MLSSRKTATQTRPSSSPKRHVPPLENRTISSCVRIVERAAGDLATLNSAPGSLSALDGIRSNNYPRRRNGRANSLAKVIQTACRRYLGGMRGHLRTSALVSRRRSNLWRIRRILYSSSWLPLVAYGNHERATSHNKDWYNVYIVSLEQVIPNIFHPYLSFYLVKVKLCTQAFRRIFIFRAIFFAEIFIFHCY